MLSQTYLIHFYCVGNYESAKSFMDIFDQTSVGQAITSNHVTSKSSLGCKYLESFVGLQNEDQLSKVVKHGYETICIVRCGDSVCLRSFM